MLFHDVSLPLSLNFVITLQMLQFLILMCLMEGRLLLMSLGILLDTYRHIVSTI